uniref:Uncharacterized protein n=1 Tax=Cryptomonas curvata TaxID=233186 RepID=A0A7S0Q8X8_9CRYP
MVDVKLIPSADLVPSVNLADVRASCSDFEVVTNTSLDGRNVVGQIIGPALQVSGVRKGKAFICIDTLSTIFKCVDKYTVVDFGTFDGTSIVASKGEVMQNLRTGELCGWVQITTESKTITAIPILRTRDLEPYQAYKGPTVQISTSLALKSKTLFNDARRSAFRKAMSVSIDASLSLNDILISQVCDAAGCGARRTGLSSNVTTVVTQVKAQSISPDQILSKVSGGGFEARLGSNLNSQLAELGLSPLSIQVLAVAVISKSSTTVAVGSAPPAVTSAVLTQDWLVTQLSAVGNSSRSLEIARGAFQAVHISSNQFRQIWAVALPLAKKDTTSAVPFFAAPGAILSTVPGAPYTNDFVMTIQTRLALSGGVAFAGLSFANVSADPPSVRLLQLTLPEMRRDNAVGSLCLAGGTEWRASLANTSTDFACNCAPAQACSGASPTAVSSVACEVIPINGNVWLPVVVESGFCTSPSQILPVGLGLGLGLVLPFMLLVGLSARYLVLRRRQPAKERAERAARRRRKLAGAATLPVAACADVGNANGAGNSLAAGAASPLPILPLEALSTPRSAASESRVTGSEQHQRI